MLLQVTAVDQLTVMAREKHYREAANLLDAVSQLLTHFEPYADISRIKELRGTVSAIKGELTEEILAAFTRVGALAASVAEPEVYTDGDAAAGDFVSLGEACLVLDALGAEAVATQVQAIVGDTLAPYQSMPEFRPGGDASSLDQIERRFSWFRRTLREVEHRFSSVFPGHWRVGHRLAVAFLELTKDQVLQSLSGGGPEAENVTVLLKALQRSLVFEKELCVRFEGSSDEVSAAQASLDEQGRFVDPSSAEGIKRRHDLEREKRDRVAGGGGAGSAGWSAVGCSAAGWSRGWWHRCCCCCCCSHRRRTSYMRPHCRFPGAPSRGMRCLTRAGPAPAVTAGTRSRTSASAVRQGAMAAAQQWPSRSGRRSAGCGGGWLPSSPRAH